MQLIQFSRWDIASEQHLPPVLCDGIDRFEEFLLAAPFSHESLDVVDGKNLQLTKTAPELLQVLLSKCPDKLIHEVLRWNIAHASLTLDEELPRDRLQEVSLAKAAASMQEEGIEGDSRRPKHLECSSVSDPVRLSDDKSI